MQADSSKEIILNSRIKDSGGKIIFENNVLCSQFLRNYVELPFFKEVKPEDIEDVSEQFVPLFAEERNADCVKRIRINDGVPFFCVSLIEHKTKPEYNVCMQIFRYMVYIWDAYEKEMEKKQKGISKHSDFKYPPIIPIVYYEGTRKWTVPSDFRSRVMQGENFGKYIPDFSYYLVPIKEYTNEELLDKGDEISLLMLINKMQDATDIDDFKKLPMEKFDNILKHSPEYLREIISNVLLAFLLKTRYPMEEAVEIAGKVKEKKMGQLFECMEDINVIELRKEWKELRGQQASLREEQASIEKEQANIEKEQANIEKEQANIEKEQANIEKEQANIKERETMLQTKEREIISERETLRRSFVDVYREIGMSKDIIAQKLAEALKLDIHTAQAEVNKYYK